MDWQSLLQQLDQDDTTRQERLLKSRLEERARLYAQPKASDTGDDSTRLHLLTFGLGDTHYAVPVQVVRGVRSVERITRVPSVPMWYRGVVNVRGQIISVLDLRPLLAVSTHTDPREYMLWSAGGLFLAVLADHVDEVKTIQRQDVFDVALPFALGMTADQLVVLDVETLFNDDRLVVGGL